jgi:hypothetical protein
LILIWLLADLVAWLVWLHGWSGCMDCREMRKLPFQFAPRPARRLSRVRWWLCAAVLLVASGIAQNSSRGGMLPQPIGQRAGDSLDGVGPGDPLEEEKRLVALNAQRQKSLVSDTNKLVRLANELGSEISRDNPSELTPAQLHKVAEIEKLARSVKDKMSTSVRGTPSFLPPPIHIP